MPRPPIYPFHTLEVGDSFALNLPLDDPHFTTRLTAAARKHTSRHGSKFSVRTMNYANEVRCWRIS